MTTKLFLDDPRLRAATGTVLASGPEGIVLDRTVFYARSGGQPGDIGVIRWDGGETPIADTLKGEGETVLHLPAPGAPVPPVGAVVEGEIDWARRYKLMRMHTAMHLLCSLIKGAAVTGGSVGPDRSRLDFDLPDPPPKEQIEAGLNAMSRRIIRCASSGWMKACWTAIPISSEPCRSRPRAAPAGSG